MISILSREKTDKKKLTTLCNVNDLQGRNDSSIVLEGIRTVLFFYQVILHKNKIPKYLNTPKKHNKAHSLGKKCPDKIADKKIITFCLKTRCNDKTIST